LEFALITLGIPLDFHLKSVLAEIDMIISKCFERFEQQFLGFVHKRIFHQVQNLLPQNSKPNS